jgi:L-fuconolactonase
MRIDAHQHYWDLEKFKYGWMPKPPDPIAKTFLPKDLEPILEHNRFDGSVFVQANTIPQEADWIFNVAERHPSILGVVAWVDLTAKDLGNQLDKMQKNARFCGIRHPVHDEADPKWLIRADVIDGLRELERRNIPFDLLLRPQHFPVVAPIAEKFPNLNLILDHLGKPNIAKRQWDGWAEFLEQWAGMERLTIKVSGMITEADKKEWKASDLTPYVQHILRWYGPDRMMFGSDWPVCLHAGSWKQTLASFTQALGAQTVEVREKILGDTAARVYGLKVKK